MPRVLIVGASTRAAAESAARAGYEVTALDAYHDLDQHPAVRAMLVPRGVGRRFGVRAVGAARAMAIDAVAYLAPFENDGASVRALADGRALWGNPASTLACVRDPRRLSETLRALGHAAPPAWTGDDAAEVDDAHDGATRWLVKPRASGGGRGVRAWVPGAPVPRGAYRQAYVEGTPGSVVFVADGARAAVLGVSVQLVGESAFGTAGHRWCGNLLGAASPALTARATALAGAVTTAFGLVGVNGIDFVARHDVPHAIEVNPRWSSSMELVERARGTSVFAAHADACVHGRLPAMEEAAPVAGVFGKAVVFARRAAQAGDTRAWLDDPSVRDVPRPGATIARGAPICTVFAEGSDADACRAALERRAESVYRTAARWTRVAA